MNKSKSIFCTVMFTTMWLIIEAFLLWAWKTGFIITLALFALFGLCRIVYEFYMWLTYDSGKIPEQWR